MLRNRKYSGEIQKQTKGQSLVEFALVGVLLFSFLMGIMDGARLLFTYSVVSNAAQEGTRYGALRPRDILPPAEATTIAQNATLTPTALRRTYIDSQVVSSQTACNTFNKARAAVFGLTQSNINVSSWYDNGDGTPVPVANQSDLDATAIRGNRLVVEASYRFDFIVPYMAVFLPNGINVTMNSARTILSDGTDSTFVCVVNYTPAPTYTPTATNTASSTPTSTSTSTPTNTPTQTPTSATSTPTRTLTPTTTPTPLRTVTPTVTSTSTVTPSFTVTQTPTITPTVTRTGTPTISPTVTRTVTPTVTSTVTATYINTSTPTRTVTPGITSTVTPTPIRMLTVTSVNMGKPSGTKPVDVTASVVDESGAPYTAATVSVTVSGTINGTFTMNHTGGGVYKACSIGSMTNQGILTASVTASAPGYVTGTGSSSTIGPNALCP